MEISEKFPEDLHLIILGNGPEEDKVKETSRKKDRVHHYGFQPKEKTIPLIRGSDILIQPSLMEGGTSSTLLEAMACKTPIIATRVGGNKETIIHMKTAYVVSPNNPEEILKGILTLLNDENMRKNLINNANEVVHEYEWENIGKKYLELYMELCNSS